MKLEFIGILRLCVKFLKSFSTTFLKQKHVCLVFEKLGMSVYDFLKLNGYRGFPLSDVRSIAKQLLTAVNCKTHFDT